MGGFWLLVAGVGMGGGSAVAETRPTVPGIEYTSGDHRLNYTARDARLHWSASDNRVQWISEEQ